MNGVTRRQFIRTSVSASGGLALAFWLPGGGFAAADTSREGGQGEINAWLLIEPDDSVIIRVAQSEMGQGVFTSMAMIVAEELEVDWTQVRPEFASANRHVREGGVYQRMATGGSRAVRHSRPYLQAAGAGARARLVQAAAERWKVPAEQCEARAGRVLHAASGRSARYGELAGTAARIDLGGREPPIKSPAEFRLLGKPTARLDVPAKVDGSAIFGCDVRIEGMVYAAIRHCPVIGGALASYDFPAIEKRRGIIAAVALDNAVAVVADSYWRAQSALEALPVSWRYGPGKGRSSETWKTEFAAALDAPGSLVVEEGDVAAALAGAEQTVEADYIAPYLAHACMEPMNCTAQVREERVDIWLGVQNPDAALQVAAAESGVAAENCHVHNCFLGGGFGRRSNPDIVREAVRVAKAVGRPVQLIWSREEDTRQGSYRPMAALRFRAGLDGAGAVRALYNHSVAHSIALDQNPAGVPGGVDRSSVDGIANSAYRFAVRRIESTNRNTHLTSWYWRSVGASQNAWAMESFVDELATAAAKDPFEFRRSLLEGRADFLQVLDVLREKSGWGRAMPAGSAQGMAIHEGFGTIVGQVVEVSISRGASLRVERVVSVVDCGHAVNPLTIEEQIESGIVFGLSAALYGKLSVVDGEVTESNFHDYRVMRLRDSPRMETYLALSGGDKWGGIGEPGLPPVAPALCNAVFRITGRRIRSLPIAEQDLSWT